MFPSVSRWAPLPLRLIVGYGFIVHGFAKLSRGPDTFAAILHTLGIPLPLLFAWLTTLVELAGGTAILAGAFVPLASAPMAVVLLTALFTVHLPYGFSSVRLVEVSALVAGGAGPLSIDQWRVRNRRNHRPSEQRPHPLPPIRKDST